MDVVVYDGAPATPDAWPLPTRFVVQCKRWSGKVSIREAHRLLRIALERNADAIFVTSSRYREEHVVADLRELPGRGRRVEAADRSGVTIRVNATWIRELALPRDTQGQIPESARDGRDYVTPRLIDRAALKKMMGRMSLTRGYDFGDE